MNDNLIQRIDAVAAVNPGKLALVDGDREIDYGELSVYLHGAAVWAENRGIRSGDWVSITVHDQYLHLLISLALMELGCTQVCLASFEKAETNQKIADRLPLRWQIVEARLSGLAGIEQVLIESLSDLSNPGPDTLRGQESCAGYGVIFTSSGTTGRPKLVCFNEPGLANFLCLFKNSLSVLHQRVSIEYNVGKRRFLGTLFESGTVVSSSTCDLVDVVQTCHRHKVTKLFLSAYHVRELLSHARADLNVKPLSSETEISLSGSAIPIDLFNSVKERLGGRVTIAYGATEIGRITQATSTDLLVDPNSVGYPAAGVDIQIVDEAYRPVTAGRQGLIGIKSDACVKAYLFDDELNARHFRDGWFYPGDMGSLKDDGMLIFYGRADDMMIMNSINIFPAEIENIAATYPAVVDCAAFPIKSETHGAIPALAVISAQDIDLSALLRFCRTELGIRAPRRVFQVSTIPRNAQGKVLRKVLAETVSELSKQASTKVAL